MKSCNPRTLNKLYTHLKAPSKIQREAIPVALDGHDVIGLAETGSGKTGAFALPMLHDLIKNPSRLFGLVMTPTRELAYQIAEQIDKLGAELKVKTVTLVGEWTSTVRFLHRLIIYYVDKVEIQEHF